MTDRISSPSPPERVTVVVVHWGLPSHTRTAVAAIRKAGISAEQILVVENGMSAQVPGSEARTLSLSINLGYAGGVNRGCAEALRRGASAVLVLNNDLTYRPGTVEAMLARLSTNRERIGCVGAIVDEGDSRPVWGGGRVSWMRGRAHLAHAAGAPLDYVSGACFLLSRACLEDVGELPEHYFLYWEDVAYGFRLRKLGWTLAVAETPSLLHLRSRGTTDARRKTYYLVRNGALFVREYAPKAARVWLLTLEGPRRGFAAQRGRWEIVRALDDARRGVTGPLLDAVNLASPS